MNTFYDRRETDGQIEFEFHHMPLVSLVFFLALAASLGPGCSKGVRLCCILLIVWMIGLLPAWVELEKAMRTGTAVVSGSKLSFTNPLKVVISKK
jgi:hypothetical protein